MSNEFNVAGVTFRAKESEEFRKLIPIPNESKVSLVHCPYINEDNPEASDNLAVKVFVDDVFVGYIPKNSMAREAFHESLNEGVDINAKLVSVSYAEYNDRYNIINNTFSENPAEGYIGSLMIGFESSVDSYSYTIGNKRYLRASVIAGMIDTIGFIIPKFLYNWMVDATKEGYPTNTHDEYVAKVTATIDSGNRIHKLAENYSKFGIGNPDLPEGVINFFNDFNVRPISCETLVKSGRKYCVAGRYDLLATARVENNDLTVIIDWKTSKTLKFAHVLKGAFYANRTGASEVWIVLLGTKNKCGYSLKRMKEVDRMYKIFHRLTVVAYEMIDLGFGKMFGVKNERKRNNSRKLSIQG